MDEPSLSGGYRDEDVLGGIRSVKIRISRISSWSGMRKSNQPKPMEYPWNDELQPALQGTYTYEGKTYKTGFQLLWEQVEQYTLEYAGGICELEPERIEKAIRMYAQQTPSGIAIGVSTDQTPNSVQAAMSTATLDLLMGNVERPGALLQRFRTSGGL